MVNKKGRVRGSEVPRVRGERLRGPFANFSGKREAASKYISPPLRGGERKKGRQENEWIEEWIPRSSRRMTERKAGIFNGEEKGRTAPGL
jgi:hypothetical protein